MHLVLKLMFNLLSLGGWILIGLLVLSFLNSILPVADSVSHFRVHLLVLLCIPLLAWGFMRRWRQFGGVVLFMGATTASLYNPLMLMNAFSSQLETYQLGQVKLLQLNVSFQNENLKAIKSLVDEERPDFITFQEITARQQPLLQALLKEYPTQMTCKYSRAGDTTVLSKWPMVDADVNSGCAEKSGFGWVRLKVRGQDVSIASVHLHWPFPYWQPEQVATILPLMAKIPGPVIVGGDFNAAAWSHSVTQIAKATKTLVASGVRFTQKTPVLGGHVVVPLPIDHVLVPLSASTTIKVGPHIGSDHRPVIANIFF